MKLFAYIREKYNKKNNLIIIILLISFIKGLMWIALIPLFNTPDEPAHFDYVQKIAENNKIFFNKKDKKDIYLSKEVVLATEYSGLLDVFHTPLNKYNFNDGERGKNENKINNIPVSLRKTISSVPGVPALKYQYYTCQYPPLYYLCSTIFYYLFYSESIIVRTFAIRIFSLLLGLLTIFTTYKIAEIILNKDKYIPAIISLLVSFNPMFTFVSSSVNSDCLLTLLFTIFLYYYIKIGINRYKIGDIMFLIIIILLGFFTKQQFILSLLILFVLLIFVKKYSLKTKIIIGVISSFLFMVAALNLKNNFPVPVFEENIRNIFKYFFSSCIPFFFKEFPASFFGNFGWLDTPMPDYCSKVLLALVLLCIFLFILDIFKSFFSKKSFLAFRIYVLLLIPIIIYIMGIIYIASNIKLGLQGRFFFPIIAFIYISIISGLLSIISKRYQLKILVAFSVSAVLFNMYCLLGIILFRYYL